MLKQKRLVAVGLGELLGVDDGLGELVGLGDAVGRGVGVTVGLAVGRGVGSCLLANTLPLILKNPNMIKEIRASLFNTTSILYYFKSIRLFSIK